MSYKDTDNIILVKVSWRAEMINCKYCGSEAMIKKGITRGKQRYYCKSCERNQVEGDERERYPEIVRKTAKILYLEGCGFRRIALVLNCIFRINIRYQLVIHWIKKAGAQLEEKLTKSEGKQTVPVLEMDELYTYVKKNGIRSEYGLMLIETGCVLLDLRSETRALTRCVGCGNESKAKTI
ncbi:MAG: hypothetical protein LBL99_01205 [Holosporaceae bacterium]|nr:hypothetical protein [Holosporaceae bacterium]